MTEPCEITVGGATWLDQAQETAAQRRQVHTGRRRGNQRAAPISQGQGPSIQDSRGNRSTQDEAGPNTDQPTNSDMSRHVQRGRGDARRGMVQRGRAQAKNTAKKNA